MRRNLVAGDIERYLLVPAPDGDQHPGAGGALHTTDHTVLRETHASDVGGIDLEQTVAGLHADLLRRAAGDDFNHHGRIVRHVELYADAGEVAGKVLLGVFQFLRRHIDGMRVEGRESSVDGRFGDLLAIDRINVMIIYSLQHQVEFAPVPGRCLEHAAALGDAAEGEHKGRTDEDADQQYKERIVLHISRV